MEEAYHAFKSGNKDKLKEWASEVISLEHQCTAFDLLVPRVKNIQKNVKTISKSDECPEEFAVDIATVIYFSSIYTMQAFERVKAQFGFRYGQKFVDRIVTKHKNVDDEVYTNLNYKADKQELKERTKDLSSLSKKRVKEEAKIIQDSNAALAEGITSLPSALVNRGSAAPAGKGKKYDSDDESEYSESEEEKPKKAKKAAKKASKKAKKESSSEEESEESESSEESSEEEKPKKKASKKAKEGKVKVAEETDSDEDVPAAAEPAKEVAAAPAQEAAAEPVKEAEPAKEAAPEVAKEETKQ